jgi:hypothetical protein
MQSAQTQQSGNDDARHLADKLELQKQLNDAQERAAEQEKLLRDENMCLQAAKARLEAHLAQTTAQLMKRIAEAEQHMHQASYLPYSVYKMEHRDKRSEA